MDSLFRDWRWIFLAVVVVWGGALVYSAVAARVLYADGAWYVLAHLLTPHRFNDYDFQRSFASFISQAPVLFGQKMGVDAVSVYAALYAVGIFMIPAAALLMALFLARRQPLLFGVIAMAIVIYGFGANFINTEANILFGLAWLAVATMALEGPAPLLRGLALPVLSFALIRVYEGMLLVGPILGIWSLAAAGRASGDRERLGLTLSGLLFFLGAFIGLGGFLSPRDPANASSFLSTALAYLRNPQLYILISAALALAALCAPRRGQRIVAAALSVASGIAFLAAMWRLDGYYAFSIYYQNRSFLVLSLPIFVGMLFAIQHFRPRWLDVGPSNRYAVILIPVSFAAAGDALGTTRWIYYVRQFCSVLEANASPAERLDRLKKSGAQTGWAWTHPTMSLLLRDRGSTAMVVNDPGQFEPFDASRPASLPYRGLCQAPLLGESRPDSFEFPMSFVAAKYPSYVASVRGLSKPEGWGTWSEGPEVQITFARPLPNSFDVSLRIATVFGSNRRLPVIARAGGKEQSFTVDHDAFEVVLAFRDARDATSLAFVIPHPESPLELGMSDDPRKLGIGFQSLVVSPR